MAAPTIQLFLDVFSCERAGFAGSFGTESREWAFLSFEGRPLLRTGPTEVLVIDVVLAHGYQRDTAPLRSAAMTLLESAGYSAWTTSGQGRKVARYCVGVRPVRSRNAALNADREVYPTA
jgi:hypothetical protein